MTTIPIEKIDGGTVTSPKGFRAGSVRAGIKEGAGSKPDLTVLRSDKTCNAAAVFTKNKLPAAPVLLSRRHLDDGRAIAVVVNSGCANACVGEDGYQDAVETAVMAAQHLGVPEDEVLVCSTGVIGRRLPMDRMKEGLAKIVPFPQGGADFAKAIMTTDTVSKQIALKAGDFTIGGAAKGSGMIHPDMATLLGFITTDADVDARYLKSALKEAVDLSFNMVSVDCDTSTNDTVILLANGMAGGELVEEGTERGELFRDALQAVCIYLAREIARDGEGATRLMEVTVLGAESGDDARKAARTIASSPLVKTAVHGCDPNWGRVMMALGRSGVNVEEGRVSVSIGGICVAENGVGTDFVEKEVAAVLNHKEVAIEVDLGLGDGCATAWGCDLTAEYVKINAEYTT